MSSLPLIYLFDCSLFLFLLFDFFSSSFWIMGQHRFQCLRRPRAILCWDQNDFSLELRGFLRHEQQNHWPTLSSFMGSMAPFKAGNRVETRMHNAGYKGTSTGELLSLHYSSFIQLCPFTMFFIHSDHPSDKNNSLVYFRMTKLNFVVLLPLFSPPLVLLLWPPTLLSSPFRFWFQESNLPKLLSVFNPKNLHYYHNCLQ